MEKDTIGIIANSNTSNGYIIFIIIIIGICILFYLMFKPKTPKEVENNEIKIVSDTKEKETFVKSEVEIKKSENNSIKAPVSKPSTTEIAKPIKEIVKEPQPIIKETITEVVVVKEEEHSKEKYIGYNPINILKQTEPLYFPYVMMPKPNCVIKFPRKGRTGRKGYKEEAFKEYIDKYFKSNYQVYDDRFVLVANNTRPYEPDFTLINEKDGINLFVDIEIDEPYEGTNDIENRKPTHFRYSDTNRNNAFTNRGWIVIRFAEIQVHEQPESCCKYMVHVLKSVNHKFNIPASLLKEENIKPVLQWTEAEAKQWSLEKYRESYLGIDSFGVTAKNNIILDIEETDLDKAIEEQVNDEVIITDNKAEVSLTKLSKLLMASVTGRYASFVINGEKRLIKPTQVYDHETSGFCYVKNEVKTYSMADIENIEIKDNYYLLQYHNVLSTIDEISEIIKDAIKQKKIIRIVYTKPGWTDFTTGEITEKEESERTLTDIDLSINILPIEHIETYGLNENYISGQCQTKNELRTFKFNRISKIEILNL